jgi:hypothetical protein
MCDPYGEFGKHMGSNRMETSGNDGKRRETEFPLSS